jgi:hypothetical protein
VNEGHLREVTQLQDVINAFIVAVSHPAGTRHLVDFSTGQTDRQQSRLLLHNTGRDIEVLTDPVVIGIAAIYSFGWIKENGRKRLSRDDVDVHFLDLCDFRILYFL